MFLCRKMENNPYYDFFWISGFEPSWRRETPSTSKYYSPKISLAKKKQLDDWVLDPLNSHFLESMVLLIKCQLPDAHCGFSLPDL